MTMVPTLRALWRRNRSNSTALSRKKRAVKAERRAWAMAMPLLKEIFEQESEAGDTLQIRWSCRSGPQTMSIELRDMNWARPASV